MPMSEIDDGYDMWYSMDMGLIHFIGFSTEVLFYDVNNEKQPQFEWLENDLKKANQNRNERPWIVVFGHRPMYCSNADNDCITKGKKNSNFILFFSFFFSFLRSVDIVT